MTGCLIPRRPPRAPLTVFRLLRIEGAVLLLLPFPLALCLWDWHSAIDSKLPYPTREERSLSLLSLCSKIASLIARSHNETPKVVIDRFKGQIHGRLFFVNSR
jgi:hypothetical protein